MIAYYNGIEFLPTQEVMVQLQSIIELLRSGRASSFNLHLSSGTVTLQNEGDALNLLESCMRARNDAHGKPERKPIPVSFAAPSVHDVVLPEALADLVPDGQTPDEQRAYLLRRLSEIGNKIQMGIASNDEKDAYSRINANMDWIRG